MDETSSVRGAAAVEIAAPAATASKVENRRAIMIMMFFVFVFLPHVLALHFVTVADRRSVD